MKTKINPRTIVLFGLIILVIMMRLITEMNFKTIMNFTPIGAIALFGGAYFTDKWKVLLVTILSIFVSDLIINNVFYKGQFGVLFDGWYFVYGSFILIAFIGTWVIKKVSVKSVISASALAALAHWLITDLGVWLGTCTDITTGVPYTKDIQGLVKCYLLALPYLQGMFLSTLFYSAIMFGAFELSKRKYPALAVK